MLDVFHVDGFRSGEVLAVLLTRSVSEDSYHPRRREILADASGSYAAPHYKRIAAIVHAGRIRLDGQRARCETSARYFDKRLVRWPKEGEVNMTFRSLLAFVGLSLALGLVGCGKGDPPPANVPATNGSDASPVAAANGAKESPEAVVVKFLDALVKGDDEIAAALLTKKALEETRSRGLKVQPPGSPGMTYQIGQTEFVGDAKDGAHVGSIWTEKHPNGQVDRFDAIWVLRSQPEGWRIVGFAVPPTEENEAMFVNFEDVEDLLQKLGATEDDLAGNDPTPTSEGDDSVAPPRNARVDENGNPLR
jgi:hypothetical protein